jgi:N-methylhydantoinase A/oxoprolinase/acetone carboxylase beta subunit
MKLIGVDVGGTFTDVVLFDTDSSETAIHKVPTTVDDPSRGVMQGVLELCRNVGVDPSSVTHLYHGTTIATNAVLEYKGAVTGMITTKGYRDIIHIGRHQRPMHYSIMQEIPWQHQPLVRRANRKVVAERLVPPKGEVLVELDEAAVRRVARELAQQGVDAVAICFLFSYLNPAHEERAKAIVLEELPDAFVTTSAAVVPQFREFERFTTAAMNAFVGPKVRDYVGQLDAAMRKAGLKAELRIMRSNGGLATPQMVADLPILTLLSGPAAGVLGGAWSGALSQRGNLITFDIGGTSADIGVVTSGRFGEASARDTWIAGYPVIVPMIDIHTIGAGGGSIAYVDSGGTFKVGPQSAGSQPGPAAYGRGGTSPTVTDANLVLGRLDANNFLGGNMKLDVAAAHKVIGELARNLHLSPHEAAEGAITVVNSNMANAIRSRTVQKGIDPRDYALVAFGGAGPLHGAEVAAMVGIPEIIVPPYPGITSSMGLLTTDIKYESLHTVFVLSTDIDLDRLNTEFAHMRAELTEQFRADGFDSSQIAFRRSADARYVGQGYELRVDLADDVIDAAAIARAFDQFHAVHKAEYGHAFPQSPIEIVNIRLTGVAPTPAIKRATVPAPGGSVRDALLKTAGSFFRRSGRLQELETAFYRRDLLPVGEVIEGPAIVLQTDTTTVVPPDSTIVADGSGNLIIRLRGGK